jgi:LPS O-antigen subunit length determinant protein (WzzB/FepE family)
MALTLGDEDKRKEAMELFIRALQAAPDSFIKALSGKNYAKEQFNNNMNKLLR